VIDGTEILRAAGALLFTISLLLGGAWAVRRFGIRMPVTAAGPQVLARLPGRRSVVRVKAGACEYDILLAADHSVLLAHREVFAPLPAPEPLP
jgi:hypothetical protein